jgi:hypothetical protein
MRVRIFLLVIALAVMSAGCDETDPLEPDEDFILSVMVLDPGGRPLSGMSVGRIIDLEGFDLLGSSMADSLMYSYPNPFSGVTTLKYSADDTREVRLSVIDWRGREVRTLQHGRISGGLYSISWDQRDASDVRVTNGVYRFCLSLADTLDPHVYEFADSTDCMVIDPTDPNNREIGLTNSTGFFSTRDLDLFPPLQGHGTQTAYNEMADPAGDFSISDTLTVIVSTPAPAEGGWVYHMSRRVVLVDGPNYLEFYFVPDDSSGVFGPLD